MEIATFVFPDTRPRERPRARGALSLDCGSVAVLHKAAGTSDAVWSAGGVDLSGVARRALVQSEVATLGDVAVITSRALTRRAQEIQMTLFGLVLTVCVWGSGSRWFPEKSGSGPRRTLVWLSQLKWRRTALRKCLGTREPSRCISRRRRQRGPSGSDRNLGANGHQRSR